MSALSLVSTEASVVDAKDLSPRKLWEMEISAAERSMEKFRKRAGVAVERFTDERDSINADMKWFNIYYANTNILESALYADLPNPSVCRRYEDYQDNVARVAALILQRSLKQDINDPEDQFDATMKQTVQDRLIAGMAAAWLRFETETEAIPTSEGGTITNNAQSTQPHAAEKKPGFHDDGFELPTLADAVNGAPPEPLRKITDQSVIVDYVHWKDFLYSPCRTWGERRWVARAVYLTKEQLTKRFGKAKADLTSLDFNVLKDNEPPNEDLMSKEIFQKAKVWEIWDRTTRKVHWYCAGYQKDLLDTRGGLPAPPELRALPEAHAGEHHHDQHGSPAGLLHDSGPIHGTEFGQRTHLQADRGMQGGRYLRPRGRHRAARHLHGQREHHDSGAQLGTVQREGRHQGQR